MRRRRPAHEPQLLVIERYSVNDDSAMLAVNYTLEYPVYLSEPYSAHANFARMPLRISRSIAQKPAWYSARLAIG